MDEIPNIRSMFDGKEFPNPESEDIKLSPKQPIQNPNSYQSPFSNFCMNSLSPIPLNQKISSPINMNVEGTPKFNWRSVVTPSPLKDEKLQNFNFKTTNTRFIQKLDFAQLPSNKVQFKASLINIKVNLATYGRTSITEEETTRDKVKKRDREEREKVKPVSCKCQRSRCLKLYCDCFSSGQYCTDCNCVGCANLPEFENLRVEATSSILERNPDAFKPKLKSISIHSSSYAEHNRGCNCKKSACLKKYCECYQSGIPCSNKCKCHGCRNKDQGQKKKNSR